MKPHQPIYDAHWYHINRICNRYRVLFRCFGSSAIESRNVVKPQWSFKLLHFANSTQRSDDHPRKASGKTKLREGRHEIRRRDEYPIPYIHRWTGIDSKFQKFDHSAKCNWKRQWNRSFQEMKECENDKAKWIPEKRRWFWGDFAIRKSFHSAMGNSKRHWTQQLQRMKEL